MRRRDYRCASGHVHEYIDSMHDPVIRYRKCPRCGEPAERQIARGVQIGKVDRGTFVTDFPAGRDASGRMQYTTLARDEVERRLDYKPPEPFSDRYLEETRAKRAEKVERMIAKADAGDLKPPPELTTTQREMVEKALKSSTT